MTVTRRTLFKSVVVGAASLPLTDRVSAEPGPHRSCQPPTRPRWGRGFEGQRKADLGNGTYFNPIIAGDHPDPTILKDGADYYMTFSSFESYPGLVIWHSRDLVN